MNVGVEIHLENMVRVQDLPEKNVPVIQTKYAAVTA